MGDSLASYFNIPNHGKIKFENRKGDGYSSIVLGTEAQ